MKYETIVGLEVHVQLLTNSKLFCNCSTKFGEKANTQVCPICLGMPGVLPVINEQAVRLAIKSAFALHCEILKFTRFARKNYFYPDLPKNYQISQFEEPLAINGYLNLGKKKIGIKRAHLEEDAGKLLHPEEEAYSLVDFNRCGIPLLEIVSQPELKSPQEAEDYLNVLKLILKYLEVSDCNMEEGSLRCDANLSVRPQGENNLGVKTEVKNMNSFKSVRKALSYERERQIKLLEKGGKVNQETMLWDEKKGITLPMRSKEESQDYRYFPEPDLIPLALNEEWLKKIEQEVAELPETRKKRFIENYFLSDYDAGVLTSQKPLADYFEETVSRGGKPKLVSNWILTELLGRLNSRHLTIGQSPFTPAHLVELLKLIEEGKISGKIGKDILAKVFDSGKSPTSIIKEEKLTQISGNALLLKVVVEVIKENPKTISDYKKGKERALGFLVGMVMKKTKGRANPANVNKLLQEEIKKL
ncbi:MAG: Asp-tRNA(Asn)/Glu-tRNA(Gln) amidotransferase GatCAB subunit B [bacterium (Candidatus Ratteibacteria) CG_4_10_14_3_um_filter_41_18]|uniref:Aspartyl/glutamyl-tRNA(Asn/Gln) amidotransferase subunit B n=1 Tax=bacterium (Candidatus Ratteibacteria) CG_4_10_14_3_um_filter_41_18 TaxID=2014287 RepID=A0A2M7M3L1_9BACT|nr:MAG: aspartyl/glutamyl-tRNA amidotransferase subunit B [Candidatus Omnitrophica bacterium CG1_02_41_171]PIX77278.1 MAG: Asp-tRNA(Asn)/Glu-tRNA(Gln) amidotransferase GatCAB subunit B [bacterium (Candidatus Ratteibacteria) CG_4_10_14_3_um_filter_41_18]HCG76381.1 Asp-tRNA(Asn)/Glu-tRNA(Gln) amidotransferase GatCAB subunit B [bacterium]